MVLMKPPFVNFGKCFHVLVFHPAFPSVLISVAIHIF